MKIAVRQRYPETSKELKIVRSYEEYARFEAELNDIIHGKINSLGIVRRVEELNQESAGTLEALKAKQPVRIPEMKGKEKLSDVTEKGIPINLFRLIRGDQIKNSQEA